MSIRIPRLGRPGGRTGAASGGRRSIRIKLALGGLALVGIGAAATSAAWTNAAYFKAAGNSGSVDLRACSSTNPGATTPVWVCETADTTGAAHAILSSSAFNLMTPGHTYTTTVRLENDGTVPLAVTNAIAGLAEPLTGTAPNATLAVTPASATIAAGGSQILTITVTTPTDWDMSHSNKTSTAALQVTSTGQTT